MIHNPWNIPLGRKPYKIDGRWSIYGFVQVKLTVATSLYVLKKNGLFQLQRGSLFRNAFDVHTDQVQDDFRSYPFLARDFAIFCLLTSNYDTVLATSNWISISQFGSLVLVSLGEMHYIKPYSFTNNPQKTQALPGYQPLKITQVSHLEGQNTNALSRQFCCTGVLGGEVSKPFGALKSRLCGLTRPGTDWPPKCS